MSGNLTMEEILARIKNTMEAHDKIKNGHGDANANNSTPLNNNSGSQHNHSLAVNHTEKSETSNNKTDGSKNEKKEPLLKHKFQGKYKFDDADNGDSNKVKSNPAKSNHNANQIEQSDDYIVDDYLKSGAERLPESLPHYSNPNIKNTENDKTKTTDDNKKDDLNKSLGDIINKIKVEKNNQTAENESDDIFYLSKDMIVDVLPDGEVTLEDVATNINSISTGISKSLSKDLTITYLQPKIENWFKNNLKNYLKKLSK